MSVPAEQGIRLKYIAPLRNERATANSAHIEYLGLENIESWAGKLLVKSDAESTEDATEEGAANVFHPDDVLFGKLRPYLAKAWHSDRDGVCTTELLVLEPSEKLWPRYLLYLLLSPEFVYEVDSSTFGAKMPRANWDFIGNIKVAVPPLEIQRRIADYLDRETARIDALVAEKEKMLALLEEKRTALISHAVTRGLNPNAPMKPSGLDWLGDIPAHWEVRALKRISSRIDTGTTPGASYMDGSLMVDFIWYTPGDIENGCLLSDSRRKIPYKAIEDNEAKVFPSKSVMVIGIGATLGKVAISSVEFSANQQINVIAPSGDALPEFLLYALYGYEAVFRAHANSATLPILNQDRLGMIPIPLPPREEQSEIVAAICEKEAVEQRTVKSLIRSIELLKERRAALITAAVTGQLDLEEMTV